MKSGEILFNNEPSKMKAAVCLAIVSSDGKLLLTKRASSMMLYPAAWVLPGGHLDPGESLERCALREAEEEVGINCGQNAKVTPYYMFESVNRNNLKGHLIVFFMIQID